MSRYIDADALETRSAFWSVGVKGKALDTFIKLSEVSTIDIVRCGECKRHGASLNDGCVYCTQLMWTMKADDFCSYGCRSEKPNNSKERSE